MSRPRSKSSLQKRSVRNTRRSRHSRIAVAGQIFRGLVLEGAGVAVLLFLFLTIQNTPDVPTQQAQSTVTAQSTIGQDD